MFFKLQIPVTKAFPSRFLPALERIDLSHNRIVNISNGAFERQRRLLHLRLDMNKIEYLTKKTLLGLTELKSLSLKHNRIVELPNDLFTFSPSIHSLDLGHNKIVSISPFAFRGEDTA